MMEFGIFEILISLAGLFVILWSYSEFRYDYWEKLGVSGPRASFPFGNFSDVFLWNKFSTDKIQEMYNVFKKERFFGYFVGRTPFFVVNDPDLIKQVLVKDFNVFSERGIIVNEDVDPLSAHLFNIGGERWRILRPRVTAFFSTGKIRCMIQSIIECGDSFVDHLNKELEKCERIECREHSARYSTDVIGSCAFGIDTQALVDEKSIFRKIGHKIFKRSVTLKLKRLMRQVEPGLFHFLRLTIVPAQVTRFFLNIMKKTVEMREKEQIVRNDLIDILMRIPNDSAAAVNGGFECTEELLAAQAFLFFAAGLEMSSATISFALWELARNPEAQERLRREILEYDGKCDGKITYESVNEMKYIDMVIKETLRKNTPVGVLNRTVMHNDYSVPGSNVILPAGQVVQIPAHALHHDPQYFPNPEVFDPERFTDDAKKARHPMVFLPFGNGPKNCVGTRFGYYQVKVALIKVIKNFRVHPTTKIDEPYVVDQNSIILDAIGGVVLKFERLDY